jgi:transcriptional regulator with GAF, ATPase, and Fis domain
MRQEQGNLHVGGADAAGGCAVGLIVGGRLHRLAPGAAKTLGFGGVDIQAGHVGLAEPAWTLQASGGEVIVRRPGAKTTRVRPGAVIRFGRTSIPVVTITRHAQSGDGADTVLWQGITARADASLSGLGDLALAATSNAPVWLRGETGTGKERAARAIHAASLRGQSGAPWVPLNCAALPETLAEAELFGVMRGAFTGADRTRAGAFERADGGTLLLDEVGELPLSIQSKLLRVLETGEVRPIGASRSMKVDVRVIASSWRDLQASVAAGSFRLDLLHRLWVLSVELPPLRRRPADIPALLRRLLDEEDGMALWPDADSMDQICAGPWPGNVRELRNHVLRAVATGDPSRLLPSTDIRPSTRLPRRRSTRARIGYAMLAAALAEEDGNRSRSARRLGVSRSTLYRWMDDFRTSEAPESAAG